MISLFSILAYMLKSTDPNGIDLFFTMDSKKYHSNKSSVLVDVLWRKKPQGISNISYRLDAVLELYKSDLREQYTPREGRSLFASSKDVRPLTIFIFTDGAWQPKCDVSSAIKKIIDLLVELKLPEKQVGIQFISFGNNPENLKRLQSLDDELNLKG
jgi:hypothetical protein